MQKHFLVAETNLKKIYTKKITEDRKHRTHKLTHIEHRKVPPHWGSGPGQGSVLPGRAKTGQKDRA